MRGKGLVVFREIPQSWRTCYCLGGWLQSQKAARTRDQLEGAPPTVSHQNSGSKASRSRLSVHVVTIVLAKVDWPLNDSRRVLDIGSITRLPSPELKLGPRT
ncbi:hypothetical protein M8818_001982 [Zalaria obscura]|uniref:Uncharacterized protein n=1 Tax=Zalaria obscura TaxID=2024903 RepID=A0ACC3SN75_9PEZI